MRAALTLRLHVLGLRPAQQPAQAEVHVLVVVVVGAPAGPGRPGGGHAAAPAPAAGPGGSGGGQAVSQVSAGLALKLHKEGRRAGGAGLKPKSENGGSPARKQIMI